MLMDAVKQLKTAAVMLVIFTVLTGLIYPSIVTGLAQLLFPWQANGSMLAVNGKKIGSLLIGQSFVDPKYFWGRPSATTPYPYNAELSTGSNMGPSNPDFLKTVKERIDNLQKSNPQNRVEVPVDLVTASGSGLDPDISPFAAYYEAPRIALARNIPEAEVDALIQKIMQKRLFGIFGEPRVNVLQLNLALDNLTVLKD